MRLLTVVGNRPQFIKSAPLSVALREAGLEEVVVHTGQHWDPALSAVFYEELGLAEPDVALDLRTSDVATIETALRRVVADVQPDALLIYGDTNSTLAGGRAGGGVPVAHVEAGLRTYRPGAPFPEEANRRAIALLADMHFAPTPAAKANLAAERLHGAVHVTGNSGLDALRLVLGQIGPAPAAEGGTRLVLVTCHRRESFGAPFAGIAAALARLAARPGVEILFLRHPNPGIGAAPAGARTLPPLGLAEFVRLMQRADLILTDSGGVQEEAAALGRPVVILREATERPEGAAMLAGADPDRIVHAAEAWLEGTLPPPAPSDAYGDGFAATRIVDALAGRPVDEFSPNRLAPTGWSALTS